MFFPLFHPHHACKARDQNDGDQDDDDRDRNKHRDRQNTLANMHITAVDCVDQHDLIMSLYFFGAAVIVDDDPRRHKRRFIEIIRDPLNRAGENDLFDVQFRNAAVVFIRPCI